MIDLNNLGRDDLTALLAQWGYSSFHAARVWQALYQDLVTSLYAIDVRADLRERLASNCQLTPLSFIQSLYSADGHTRKFLLQLKDGEAIETVIMRHNSRGRDATQRYTACISTQAGCAMGCVFCATGQMGFKRHLAPGEIVAQVVFVQRLLAAEGASLRNIVLMGMGEPLHNYDNTMRALDIVCDDKGLALAPRHITLSTVGLPAAIRRLADEARPINLAVSLHAATDAERAALVPPAKRWPLAELIDACRYYTETRQRRIFFEWTLIEGKNDTEMQAQALGALLHGMNAHINVIPLNPTGGFAGQPSNPERVRHFQQTLSKYGLPSTVRQRRGIDIAAGCGQLRQREMMENL